MRSLPPMSRPGARRSSELSCRVPFGRGAGRMGIAALVTALLLHAHMHAQTPQHRQHVVVHPVWPAQGTITGAFGHDGSRPHPGIDIGILRSLSVRAAVPGRVVGVGPQVGYEGYGNLVRIRSRGYTELYAHLASW